MVADTDGQEERASECMYLREEASQTDTLEDKNRETEREQ